MFPVTRFQKISQRSPSSKTKIELKWSTKDIQITQKKQERSNKGTKDMENKQKKSQNG